MRGRTNITPRKEPIINGQLITATVEVNDSISVGDFVEYRIDYAETATSDYNISVIDELETSIYKILLIAKNSQAYLELWKKSTQERVDNIVINESGSTAIMCLADNSHVIIFSNYIYYYIEISNDEISIVQQLSYGASPNPTALCVLDSSHFGGFVKKSGSSNYDMRVYIFTFSDSAITYQNYKEFSLGYATTTYASYVKKVATNRVMLFGTSSISSYSKRVHLISFDSNFDFSNISDISFETAVKRVDINDNLFAFLNYTEAQYSSGNDRFELYLMKYDSTNDVIATFLDLDLSTIFGTFPFRRGSASISLLNENQLAICGCVNVTSTSAKREGVILSYDENEDTYSISEKIEVANTLKYTDVKFTIADLTDAKIVSEIGFIKLKIQDNEFEHVPNKNYVKSYTGGKAIGFAKTAGSAGQTVSIYVPVV